MGGGGGGGGGECLPSNPPPFQCIHALSRGSKLSSKSTLMWYKLAKNDTGVERYLGSVQC